MRHISCRFPGTLDSPAAEEGRLPRLLLAVPGADAYVFYSKRSEQAIVD
jgi:hypothetical protein